MKEEQTTWKNVLLTDSGLFDPFDLNKPLEPIVDKFLQMVNKPLAQARVLFIPAAAFDDEAKKLAGILRSELLWLGFTPQNITTYMLDKSISETDIFSYDVMFFTGGWCEHLLRLIKQTGFDEIIKNFVFSNRTYVGVSAGSVIATPNIMGTFERYPSPDTKGLELIPAYIDVHCDMRSDLTQKDHTIPHITLHAYQALAVSSTGYELLEASEARHKINSPPVMGVDIYRLDNLHGGHVVSQF